MGVGGQLGVGATFDQDFKIRRSQEKGVLGRGESRGKGLEAERAWCVGERARPVWLELSEQGGEVGRYGVGGRQDQVGL